MLIPSENNLPIEQLANAIRLVVQETKAAMAQSVNTRLLQTYWQVGKLICDQEETYENGINQLLLDVSKTLTKQLGKGFSRSNLLNMRKFYQTYSTGQTLSGQLSWSHYCELISIDEAKKRSFYMQESMNSKWSVRELKRQIESSLFERLLLSEGKTNKQKVLQLAQKGQEIKRPEDILREPYVLEFLGIPENKPMLERDLERKLIRHIENFLLELGRGFMFVGSQQRITIGNEHQYVDMVFYNKILRAYVLIDLKMRKIKPADIGQMNTYLNYYKTEINEKMDNEPIGIILCTGKDQIVAEYALGGLTNHIFASKYIYYLPNQDELIQQVQRAIETLDEEE